MYQMRGKIPFDPHIINIFGKFVNEIPDRILLAGVYDEVAHAE